MGNSASSCNDCASQSALSDLTTEVEQIKAAGSSGSGSAPAPAPAATYTASVSTVSAGPADSSQKVVNGWTSKSEGMSSDQPTASTVGADQTCPSGQVVCGVSFVHKGGENETYQEWFKVNCCDPKVTIESS